METTSTPKPVNKRKLRLTVFFRLFMFLFLMVLMFFLPAGSFKYWQGWVYIGIIIIPMLFAFRYLIKHDPELLERRMRNKEQEKEQKVLIKMSYVYFLAAFLLPGFDIRYGWSDVPWYIVILADILILAGYYLFVLVLKENSYASRIIETDEKQKVITSGPYAIVRHPMYTAVLVMYLLSPLALASYWAVLPALMLILIIVFRIIHEEKILCNQLEGYREYKKSTKYRLIPGIW